MIESDKIYHYLKPRNVYVLVWGSAFLLYQVRIVPFQPLGTVTMLILLTGSIAFLIGCCTAELSWKIRAKAQEDRFLYTSLKPFDGRVLEKVLLVFMLLQIAYIYVRVNAILSSTHSSFQFLLTHASEVRHLYVINSGFGVEKFDFTEALIINLLGLFNYIAFLLGGICYANSKKSYYGYFSLFIAIIQGLLLLNRYNVIINILAFLLGYGLVKSYLKYYLKRNWRIKRDFAHLALKRSRYSITRSSGTIRLIFVTVTAVVLSIVANDYFMKKSSAWSGYLSSGVPSTIMSVYWYLTGPIAAFDQVVLKGQDSYMPGAYTFRIVTKWLAIGGFVSKEWVAPAIGPNVALYFSPVPINVYTWYEAFYSDFGLVGIAIGPFIIGLVSSWLYFSLLKSFSLARLVSLSVLMGVIFFSIMGFTLQDIEQLMVVALAYVVDRVLRITTKTGPAVPTL